VALFFKNAAFRKNCGDSADLGKFIRYCTKKIEFNEYLNHFFVEGIIFLTLICLCNWN
jgi:hypothetical protein